MNLYEKLFDEKVFAKKYKLADGEINYGEA